MNVIFLKFKICIYSQFDGTESIVLDIARFITNIIKGQQIG